MKGVLLIVAVLSIILISGCTIPSSEEMRAMDLAAQTTEGQIMAKMYDASVKFQYCTTQDVIEFISTLPQAQQPTEEQLQQLDAQIEIMKKCIPRIDIQAKDMTDGIYNVEYTTIPPEACTNPQMMESFKAQSQPTLIIEVNLNNSSTRVIKGKIGIDPAQIQELFAQMETVGDCAALMLMAFTSFTTQSPQAMPIERQQLQPCSAAFILIQSGLYHSETNTLDLIVWNNGGMDLSGFTVIITPNNGSVSTHSRTVTIAAGARETLSITPISSDIKQAVVRSDECRGVQAILSEYDIN